MHHPHETTTRTCPNCDDFPIVAIDAGYRLPDGTRATLKVVCLRCDGTGRIPTRIPIALEVGA